ncbi:hypothetical protein WR25_14115 [Diploscapter pachys]|uniref:Uncharacterized protein n=1 Tax=Diploscapter pachys TaxID=2018661 RepID=A0A2A2M544_9BILA|nr:hypothetical protein WR25_14115 [Diploscapter pachys]
MLHGIAGGDQPAAEQAGQGGNAQARVGASEVVEGHAVPWRLNVTSTVDQMRPCRGASPLARHAVHPRTQQDRQVVPEEQQQRRAGEQYRQPQPQRRERRYDHARQCRQLDQCECPTHAAGYLKRASGMPQADPRHHRHDQPGHGADRQCMGGQARAGISQA